MYSLILLKICRELILRRFAVAEMFQPMLMSTDSRNFFSLTALNSFQVRTLSGEFRLTPFRAPEIVNYRRHCHGGRVDFQEWLDNTGDREWVENLWAIVQHP